MQNGSTSNPQAYAEKADLALRRRGARGINSYTQEYRAGSRSLPFLREYLVKLKELEMRTDEVLDEYTSQLPPDSLANFNTVRFIYQFISHPRRPIYRAVLPPDFDRFTEKDGPGGTGQNETAKNETW